MKGGIVKRMIAVAVALLGVSGSAPAQSSGVRVAFLAEGVPTRPDDPAWGHAPEATIALLPQLISIPNGGGSVKEVSVRSLHDGEWLAVRLEWADATANRSVGVDSFRDAVAVGFPASETEVLPAPFMGDVEHPVNIWQWSADLEADAAGRGSFAERYPHTEGVWYFPQDADVSRDVEHWRGMDPVVEFIAVGWGTLERRPVRNVFGASVHQRGRWSVVLRRHLATGYPKDAPFRPGQATHLIVAVWDGGLGEVNGRKSVTMGWTPLTLEATVRANVRP